MHKLKILSNKWRVICLPKLYRRIALLVIVTLTRVENIWIACIGSESTYVRFAVTLPCIIFAPGTSRRALACPSSMQQRLLRAASLLTGDKAGPSCLSFVDPSCSDYNLRESKHCFKTP